MQFLYWILHSLIGCLQKDIIHNRGYDLCSKCGRITFVFKH
jgi:hypothetical protein